MSESTVLDGAVDPRANPVLVGHEAAQSFLAQAYRSGRIHHAVLIEGARGIGKATLAFRFANHVLRYPEPHDAPAELAEAHPESTVFRHIASGASPDLLHLERPTDEKTGRVKSAITVDEVRRAGRFFGQTSGTGAWRIVIVDPADDLNRSAANAILKMLEEPPRRSLFLVLSHAPGRLLPTIRSRCLSLRLSPLTTDEVDQALQALPAGQGTSAKERSRAAERSDGSVQQAVMMLNYGGLDIVDAFEAIMAGDATSSRLKVHALADTLSAKDRDDLFTFFCDHVSVWLGDRARMAAAAGDIQAAATDAALAERIANDVTVAGAYNLDRKQTVLSLFSCLFAARLP
ncbi:DNA polymerase III subunit delta' [Pararhizobium haloflavum]|uniref:DNA polymerase III subunit delta' n=1 Tax=Pararhizobium haloflavum TaxID=2037914 RepID=UPI000C18C596|nr:DNA polymerase III subunit delta' [Pararhizobium haloflavum]